MRIPTREGTLELDQKPGLLKSLDYDRTIIGQGNSGGQRLRLLDAMAKGFDGFSACYYRARLAALTFPFPPPLIHREQKGKVQRDNSRSPSLSHAAPGAAHSAAGTCGGWGNRTLPPTSGLPRHGTFPISNSGF